MAGSGTRTLLNSRRERKGGEKFMAAGDNTCTGIRIVSISPDPVRKLKVKVAGNVEIARGEMVEQASGLGDPFSTAGIATDTDDFIGIALEANEGDEGSAIRNEIAVSTRCVIDATFASAPGSTIYIGTGVAVVSAENHVYTFGAATSGASQCGWMFENGDGSSTTRKVLIDTVMLSHGQQLVTEGMWEPNAAE